jgi:hypothetical protein
MLFALCSVNVDLASRTHTGISRMCCMRSELQLADDGAVAPLSSSFRWFQNDNGDFGIQPSTVMEHDGRELNVAQRLSL